MRTASPAQRSIRRHLVLGLAGIFMLVGVMGGWAATTQFTGAVITPGVLVVASDVKKVQHPTGGVVAELNVRDGDQVKEGDVLIRLDDTVTRANLAIVVKSQQQLAARQARLEAERDDAASVVYPDTLAALSGDPEVARLMSGETRLFELRRTAREGQKAQLRERVSQLREEMLGVTAQVDAKAREIELIEQELVGVRELWKKKLTQIQRVNALERDAARLEGERGALVASMAEAKGRVSEIELQIIQIDQDLRSEVASELRDIQAKTAELVERQVGAEDQLKRIDIRAPKAGRVHQLAVHTVGGVIPAGDTLMLIVPTADALTVEVKIAPQDIDQVHVGQAAALRFSAFDQRTTPEIDGRVSLVAADLTSDQRTGASYYTGRITISPGEMSHLGQLVLAPGMPVEAFIQTGERTVLSYLTKPLSDHMRRSFRGS
jgi:HlyD family secretion protein